MERGLSAVGPGRSHDEEPAKNHQPGSDAGALITDVGGEAGVGCRDDTGLVCSHEQSEAEVMHERCAQRHPAGGEGLDAVDGFHNQPALASRSAGHQRCGGDEGNRLTTPAGRCIAEAR